MGGKQIFMRRTTMKAKIVVVCMLAVVMFGVIRQTNWRERGLSWAQICNVSAEPGQPSPVVVLKDGTGPMCFPGYPCIPTRS